jgi:hypothetical protein
MRFDRPDPAQVESLIRRRCAAWLGPNPKLTEIVHELVGGSHAEVERVCFDAAKRAALATRRVLVADDWAYALGRHRERRQTMDARPDDRPPAVDRE